MNSLMGSQRLQDHLLADTHNANNDRSNKLPKQSVATRTAELTLREGGGGETLDNVKVPGCRENNNFVRFIFRSEYSDTKSTLRHNFYLTMKGCHVWNSINYKEDDRNT